MLERDGCKEKVQTTDKESSGMDKGGGKKKGYGVGWCPPLVVEWGVISVEVHATATRWG